MSGVQTTHWPGCWKTGEKKHAGCEAAQKPPAPSERCAACASLLPWHRDGCYVAARTPAPAPAPSDLAYNYAHGDPAVAPQTPAPAPEGAAVLTREEFLWQFERANGPLAEQAMKDCDAALRAEVERLRAIKDESPAFATALARADAAEAEVERLTKNAANDAALHLNAEQAAAREKARADALEDERALLRADLAAEGDQRRKAEAELVAAQKANADLILSESAMRDERDALLKALREIAEDTNTPGRILANRAAAAIKEAGK